MKNIIRNIIRLFKIDIFVDKSIEREDYLKMSDNDYVAMRNTFILVPEKKYNYNSKKDLWLNKK